jgi:hypothetical protein
VDDKKAVHIIHLLLASPEASAILNVTKSAIKSIQTPRKGALPSSASENLEKEKNKKNSKEREQETRTRES